MPVINSAAKRVRTSDKARKRNASVRSRISSARRQTFEAFSTKDPDESSKQFREYSSILDKAAKKGIIKKNTSIRRKKRVANALADIMKKARKTEAKTA